LPPSSPTSNNAVAELRSIPDRTTTTTDYWVEFRRALRGNGVRDGLTDDQQIRRN
jgi:hypothetical protein